MPYRTTLAAGCAMKILKAQPICVHAGQQWSVHPRAVPGVGFEEHFRRRFQTGDNGSTTEAKAGSVGCRELQHDLVGYREVQYSAGSHVKNQHDFAGYRDLQYSAGSFGKTRQIAEMESPGGHGATPGYGKEAELEGVLSDPEDDNNEEMGEEDMNGDQPVLKHESLQWDNQLSGGKHPGGIRRANQPKTKHGFEQHKHFDAKQWSELCRRRK